VLTIFGVRDSSSDVFGFHRPYQESGTEGRRYVGHAFYLPPGGITAPQAGKKISIKRSTLNTTISRQEIYQFAQNGSRRTLKSAACQYC
jgi:hypothetical protein